MPGHSRAAIRSMDVRHRYYEENDDLKNAEEYYLRDPEAQDDEAAESVQKFSSNSLIPCLESTYHFIEHVLDELIKMHASIQPLKTFHFGGDEVPLGVWEHSPKCKRYLEKHHPDLTEDKKILRHAALKHLFLTRMVKLTEDKGLKIQGWEDAFFEDELTNGSDEARKREPLDKDTLSKQDVTVNVWMNTWERGYAHRPLQLANNGYKVNVNLDSL